MSMFVCVLRGCKIFSKRAIFSFFSVLLLISLFKTSNDQLHLAQTVIKHLLPVPQSSSWSRFYF